MSWAKHDPEGWMEVCRKGVIKKLEAVFREHVGGAIDDYHTEAIDIMLTGLHDGDPEANKIWDAMLTWANKEITEAEAGYLSELQDFADAQRKAAREGKS